MQTIKHIIWDWNGTLLNDAALCVDVMNKLLIKYSLPAVNEQTYARLFRFPVIEYYKAIGFDFDKISFEKVGTEFIEGYELRQTEAKLYPPVVEVLDMIKRKKIKQSVLSARKQTELNGNLTDYGIAQYFQHVQGLGDHYANGKTEAGKQLLACLNISPQNILLVGDTIHDYEVAKVLGCNCVLIPGGHNDADRLRQCTDATVLASLSDLQKIISARTQAEHN